MRYIQRVFCKFHLQDDVQTLNRIVHMTMKLLIIHQCLNSIHKINLEYKFHSNLLLNNYLNIVKNYQISYYNFQRINIVCQFKIA